MSMLAIVIALAGISAMLVADPEERRAAIVLNGLATGVSITLAVFAMVLR